MSEYTAKDYKKGLPRWCPGCGDHFFLASLHKAMAEIGVPPYETAVISGIGCSSRLPNNMNTVWPLAVTISSMPSAATWTSI